MKLLGQTSMTVPGRHKEAHQEHARVVAAIANRDSEAAETAAREHVANALATKRKQRQAAK
jgi:DNA-binding GntR family transcriptional regulator